MKLNNLQIKNSFDGAARTYDRYASVQEKSSEHLACLCTPSIKNPKTILDIGCGTGFTALAFQKYYPHAAYTLCDLSKNMIRAAKNKVHASNYIICDAENYEFSGPYDLEISNLTLQWFENIESFLGKTLPRCKYFALSILTEGSFSAYEYLFSKENIPILIHRYRHRDELLALFSKVGNVIASDFRRYDLFFENALEAAKHFKYIGANVIATQQNRAKIVAKLLSSRSKMNLNYNVLFVLLERK
ncbi:MAG: methyltransferase domain-containing protein [Puniceicoccales bacterium]|jgi:malonyl-ACP O-methyltransferase BioC|nr:methyltransferase domain-containing protein [Puniceicoccales bacterium]